MIINALPKGATTCPLCTGDGWYVPKTEPKNRQIDELLRAIDACSGKFRYQTTVEVQDKQRAAVREWLAGL